MDPCGQNRMGFDVTDYNNTKALGTGLLDWSNVSQNNTPTPLCSKQSMSDWSSAQQTIQRENATHASSWESDDDESPIYRNASPTTQQQLMVNETQTQLTQEQHNQNVLKREVFERNTIQIMCDNDGGKESKQKPKRPTLPSWKWKCYFCKEGLVLCKIVRIT